MRKKLVSLVLAVAFVAGAFGGCSLITVNSKRDMSQVIATVTTTGEDGTYSDDIYKKDLVSYFNSVGYYYLQQGASYSQTYTMLLNQLINNKIFIHESRRYFSRLDSNLTENSELADYLKEWERAKAEHNVNLAVNSLLDNFEQDVIADLKLNATSDDDYSDKHGYKEEARAVIASASDDEFEITEENYKSQKIEEHYKLYIAKKSTVIGSTETTRKKAYDKMVKAIDYYDLLGNPTFEEFKDSDFYKDELKRQMESILTTNYTEAIKNEVLAEGAEGFENAKIVLSHRDLLERYNSKFNEQKEKYTASVSDYKSALDALTKDDYILYHPELDDEYGFVYNILIPFSEHQLFKIGEIDYKSDSVKYRKALNDIIAKGSTPQDIAVYGSEQRASWITAGYEYETDGDEIYFESKLYAGEVNGDYKGIAFNGTVETVKGTNKKGDVVDVVTSDFKKLYDIKPNEKVAFDDIFNQFVDLIGGATYTGAKSTKAEQYSDFIDNGNAILYSGKSSADESELDNIRGRVRDLLFAYSTDPGSLSPYLGYAVPNDSFVKEFSDAAKVALAEGEGGFAVVVTSYGLHILYCSKTITPTPKDAEKSSDYFLPTDEEYEIFVEELKDKDSFSYKFADEYLSSLRSLYFSRHEEEITNKYNNDTNVKIFEKRFKDLLVD